MAQGTATAGARRNGWRGAAVRVFVSILFLAVVLQFIHLDDLWTHLRQTSLVVWLGAFAAFLGGHALAAAKWRWMIGGAVGYWDALKAHFAGQAAGLALPGIAGGDIVRAGLVMRSGGRKTVIGLGSLADRVIDTAALLVIAAIGAAWLGAGTGVNGHALTALAIGAAALIAGSVALLAPAARFLRSRQFSGRLGVIAEKLADALQLFSERRWTFLACALLSVAIQALFAATNGWMAISMGVATPLAVWIFAWPLAKLMATLPVSLGGLGVREATLAGLMAPLGYPAAGVVAASLAWQSILYAGAAVGVLAQTLRSGKSSVASRKPANG